MLTGEQTITKVVQLQNELLDDNGHVRRSIPSKRVLEMIDEINELRAALRWKPFDVEGRLRPKDYDKHYGRSDEAAATSIGVPVEALSVATSAIWSNLGPQSVQRVIAQSVAMAALKALNDAGLLVKEAKVDG
jgi:hypothetical protein